VEIFIDEEDYDRCGLTTDGVPFLLRRDDAEGAIEAPPFLCQIRQRVFDEPEHVATEEFAWWEKAQEFSSKDLLELLWQEDREKRSAEMKKHMYKTVVKYATKIHHVTGLSLGLGVERCRAFGTFGTHGTFDTFGPFDTFDTCARTTNSACGMGGLWTPARRIARETG
jgi:hypothetical protein